MRKIMVTKPFIPKKEEYNVYLDKIWNNEYFTNNGPLHREFESTLSEYLGNVNLVLTVNGHSALDIAQKGLNLHGEVITTPFTFVSTIHSLTLNGLKPVFCDIKSSDLTIDETKIESLITDKTCAIMPVHVYGHMCNINEISRIAKKYNLKVIYDAAHAFGVKYKEKSIAYYGDASIFSFHATKLFNTIEGGAIVFKDKKYRKIFNCFKNFGIEGEEKVDYIGCNAKMNEFQAAMGLTNLKHVDSLINERKDLTLYYRRLLDNICGIKYFIPEKEYDDFEYNYSYLPIIVESDVYGKTRDDLYNHLAEKNIYARKYFYPLVTDMGCYKKFFDSKLTPNAKGISSKILCLPLYNGLAKKDIKLICDIINNYGMEDKCES